MISVSLSLDSRIKVSFVCSLIAIRTQPVAGSYDWRGGPFQAVYWRDSALSIAIRYIPNSVGAPEVTGGPVISARLRALKIA